MYHKDNQETNIARSNALYLQLDHVKTFNKSKAIFVTIQP